MNTARKLAIMAYVRGLETELSRVAGHHEVGMPYRGACLALLKFMEGLSSRNARAIAIVHGTVSPTWEGPHARR